MRAGGPQLSGGRTFQAETIASAKALRQKSVCHVGVGWGGAKGMWEKMSPERRWAR